MTAPEYIQLKAFARTDGALLALLWTTSFVCYVAGMSQPELGMLALLLALVTPVFSLLRLKKFRDGVLEGILSFGRGWAFTLLTFFYASLLFAVVNFVYFSYMDHGYFFDMLNKMMAAPENVQILGKETMDSVSETLQQVRQMRPIDLALNIMMSNLMAGLIISIPVAALMKREARVNP